LSNRKIRVAVIGIGQIATKAHIPVYLSNKHVDLIALVDIDKKKFERAGKKFGVKKCFSSVDELFEKQDVDAVSICTPPDTHADIALKAFSHGAHVLCEKPMATTINDGKRMFKASQKEEKILMVGFNLRFRPSYQRAKKLVLQGCLGHVYCVEDHYLSPNPLLTWGRSRWFFSPEVGGVLLDQGPHVFDMLNYVFGDFPCAVSAHGSTYLDSPVEDFCVCVMEYPEDRTGIGVMSWLSPKTIENLSIHGTAQSLFVSPNLFLEVNTTDVSEVSLWRAASESLISLKFPNSPLLRNKKVNTHQLEVNHFIRRIREKQKSALSALNGLNILIACDAAKKALKTDKRIGIPSIKRV